MSEYMRELARREREERNGTEQIILELPKRGAVSYTSIERCAREAGMPVEDWIFDAISAYVRMHEREVRMRQAEAFTIGDDSPEPTRVSALRMRMGEYAYRLADMLTDDGTHHEGGEDE